MTSPTSLCLKFNEHLEVCVPVYTVCSAMLCDAIKVFVTCFSTVWFMNVRDNGSETTYRKLSSRLVRAVRQIVALPPQGMEASAPLNAVAEPIGVTGQSGIAQER